MNPPNLLSQEDTRRWAQDMIIAGWKSHDVVWHGSAVHPAIGNGSLVAYYMAIGGICYYYVHVIMGSTTTYGNGYYSWDLPVTCLPGTTVGLPFIVGPGVVRDASTGTIYSLNVVLDPTGGQQVNMVGTSTGSFVSKTDPVTLATSDQINFSLQYPVR